MKKAILVLIIVIAFLSIVTLRHTLTYDGGKTVINILDLRYVDYSCISDEQQPIPSASIPYIATGNGFSLMLLDDGSLWGWGMSPAMHPRVSGIPNHTIPTKIMEDVISVVAGDRYALVLKADSSLWEWGSIWWGITVDVMGNYDESSIPAPRWIMDDVAYITTGGAKSAAIQSDGSLWVWRLPSERQTELSPVRVLEDVVMASSQMGSTAAITSDGTLWHITSDDGEWRIAEIMEDVVFITSGHSHSFAITSSDELWAWGLNWYGQLGIDEFSSSIPSYAPVIVMENVVYASAGNEHSMAITMCGTLWGWGNNSTGQVGNGMIGVCNVSNFIHSPTQIMDSVARVSAGGRHTIAITTDGRLWAWGSNFSGELGDGFRPISRNAPTEIQWMHNELPETTLYCVLSAYRNYLLHVINDPLESIVHAELLHIGNSGIPKLLLVFNFNDPVDEMIILDYDGQYRVLYSSTIGIFTDTVLAFDSQGQVYIVEMHFLYWGEATVKHYRTFENGEWMDVMSTFVVNYYPPALMTDYLGEFALNGVPVTESEFRQAVDALDIVEYRGFYWNTVRDVHTILDEIESMLFEQTR